MLPLAVVVRVQQQRLVLRELPAQSRQWQHSPIWACLYHQSAKRVEQVAQLRVVLEPQSPGAVPLFHYAAARAVAAQPLPTLPVARLQAAGSFPASQVAPQEQIAGKMDFSMQFLSRPVADQAVAHQTRAQVVLVQMAQSAVAAAAAAAV